MTREVNRKAMMEATATATRRTRPRRSDGSSVLHELARLMACVWIPAEGLVWRVGAFSFLWAARTEDGELASGNVTSELAARKEIAAVRLGSEPRGPALLP